MFRKQWILAARASYFDGQLTLVQLLAARFISRNEELLDMAEDLAWNKAMVAGLIPVSDTPVGVDWDSLADFLKEIIPLIIEALLQLLPLFFQKALRRDK